LNDRFHEFCGNVNDGKCPYFVKKEVIKVEPTPKKEGLFHRFWRCMLRELNCMMS